MFEPWEKKLLSILFSHLSKKIKELDLPSLPRFTNLPQSVLLK